jgi:2-polyprenyl-3-methyl-5-hydroxy-6-metoxy-1,4-benzoquinol methylase
MPPVNHTQELTKESLQIKQSLGLSGNEIYQLASKLLREKNVSGSFLDFGAGQGRFLRMLPEQFNSMSGVDLMDRPADLSGRISWVQGDLNLPLSVQAESFDCILAMEIIEHLENPRAMVRELKRLLKKNGLLIISTPNNDSFRSLIALLTRGHFVSFLERDYPAHITALTQLDLRRILEEHQFSEIEFFFTNKGLVPGLRGLTWQDLSGGLLQGKRYSDNIFVCARKR